MTYDEYCNLRFVTDALGAVTEFRYNGRAQRTDFIDAVGNHWHFTYDSYGLPTGGVDGQLASVSQYSLTNSTFSGGVS